MIDKDKACRMLSKGMRPTDVAAVMGCEASYITELMNEEEFAVKVLSARMAAAEAHVEHDGNIDSLEEKILKKLDASLTYCMKPETLIRAFQVINGAKRRSDVGEGIANAAPTVINITLPNVIINQIRLNAEGRVVQVGERELVTMDKNAFSQLANGHTTAAERMAQQLQEIGRHVEAGISTGSDTGLSVKKAT